MKCNKCASASSVILRKKDHYCNDCFIIGTSHKFRACIGKHKIVSKNDRVLMCASGGAGSAVLLDLVFNGLSLDIHKKLRIVPHILHVTGTSDQTNGDSLLKLCKKYNFEVFFVHISDYITQNKKLPSVNTLPEKHIEKEEKFEMLLNSMPSTAYNDFLKKVKRSLFIQYAELLQCKYVFTAETTTSLAINLLSNLAIGRGSQVQNDVGFIDACDKNVRILRPMKDISKEELDYYIKIKELSPNYHKDVKNNSLQSVISTFVTELQGNFQSTISTVCKTADKIGVIDDENSRSCSICKTTFEDLEHIASVEAASVQLNPNQYLVKNPLTKRDLKLTALDATNFSRTVSFGKPLHEDNINETMFPFINEQLCYSCSRNYSEMRHNDLTCLPNLLQNK